MLAESKLSNDASRRLARSAGGAFLIVALMLVAPVVAAGSPTSVNAPAVHAGPAGGSLAVSAPSRSAAIAPSGGMGRFATMTPAFDPRILPDARLPSVLPGRAPSGASSSTTSERPTGALGANVDVPGTNCSQAGSLIQAGSSPEDLVQPFSSSWGLYNGTGTSSASECMFSTSYPYFNPSSWFIDHGAAGVAYSTDGGQDWSNSYLNLNTSYWTNKAANASDLPIGEGQVVANTSGSNNDLFEVTDFESLCDYQFNTLYELGYNFIPCTEPGDNSPNISASGVAVGVSSNGGASWSQSYQIVNYSSFEYLSACSGFGQLNLTAENPSIAAWPASGGVFDLAVTWTEMSIQWYSSNCTFKGLASEQYSSVSTDSGLKWSKPQLLARYSEMATVVKENNGDLDSFSDDMYNGTALNPGIALDVLMERSTNGGSSWTRSDLEDSTASPIQISLPPAGAIPNTILSAAGGNVEFVGGVTTPVSAIYDNWSSSPHEGTIYVAWGDNGTGSAQGTMAIAVTESSSPGSADSWNDPVRIVPPSGEQYFYPGLSVDPSGHLWVTFYAFSDSTGAYREYAVVSTNGGSSFSAAFPVSSSNGVPGASGGVGGGLTSLGLRHNGVGTAANGTYVSWTDCRLTGCSDAEYSQTFLSDLFLSTIALQSPTTGATTAIELNATITTYTKVTTVLVSTSHAADAIWATGASPNVTVPSIIPFSSTQLDAFQGYLGLSTATTTSTTFTVSGSGTLTANYTPERAAEITGTFFPNNAQSKLTVDGTGVSLSTDPSNSSLLLYTYTVEGGTTYTLSASSGTRWNAQSGVQLLVGAGATVYHNITLTKVNGTLSIPVSLPWGTTYAATTVNVNGTDWTPNGAGLYQHNLPWGYYFVNISNPRTTGISTAYEPVNPASPTTLVASLAGGWVTGSIGVTPAKYNDLNVTVNGNASLITVTAGNFNISCNDDLGCAAGNYWINASEPGYNSTSQEVHITAGGTLAGVNLHLSNRAYLRGAVTPVSLVSDLASSGLQIYVANLTYGIKSFLALSNYNVSNGEFNLSVMGGIGYTVVASATGYQTLSVNVPAIAYGSASSVIPLNLVLNKVVPPPCNETGNCSKSGTTSTTSSSPGFPVSLLGGIIVVVVLLAIALVALLMRRRGGGGEAATMEPTSSDGPTYGSDASTGAENWQEGPPSPPSSG